MAEPASLNPSQLYHPSTQVGNVKSFAQSLMGQVAQATGQSVRETQPSLSRNFGTKADGPRGGFDMLATLQQNLSTTVGGSKRPASSEIDLISRTLPSGRFPMPDSINAPFKRPRGEAVSNLPVSIHHLNPVNGNDKKRQQVVIPFMLSARSCEGATKQSMEKRYIEDSIVFLRRQTKKEAGKANTSGQYGESAMSLQAINQESYLDAHARNFARQRSTKSLVKNTYALVGTVKSIDTCNRMIAEHPFLLTTVINGPVLMPNLWLAFPRRLQVGDRLWLIWVERSFGHQLENMEREIMLRKLTNPSEEDDFDLFPRAYQQCVLSEHNRKMREIYHTAESGAGDQAMDISVSNETVYRKSFPSMFRTMENYDTVRYGRYEVFVTNSGETVPHWATRGKRPYLIDGEIEWSGKAVPIGTVLHDMATFDESKRHELEAKMALNSNPYNDSGIDELMASLPKISVLLCL